MTTGRHVRGLLGRPGPAPSGRELLGWLGAGAAVALAMTWPLVLRLATHVPQDAADPLAEAWEVAWGGHALRTAPLDVFRANAFWPTGPSLAFSDSLLGYAPAGLVGDGVTAAVVRYNLLFLFAYALAFAGAAALARELNTRVPAAAVAGMAFAYAPWRLAHNGHLNVLSIGGIPLALALLAGGYRRGSARRIVAGWLVAAWQVSLGFGLGIYFCYLLLVVALGVGLGWLSRGRPRPGRAAVRGTLVGGGAFALVAVTMAAPYLDVVAGHPGVRRDVRSVEFYSPPAAGLLAAPAESRVWGEATREARGRLRWPPEQALFPGMAVLLLAGIGLGARHQPRGLRVLLAVATVAAAALSLGLGLAGGRWTYLPLYRHLPGFDALRTPGRLTVFTSLGLAMLAAFGADFVLRATARRPAGGSHRGSPGSGTPPAVRAVAVAAMLAAVVGVEGSTRLRQVPVPRPPIRLASLPDPQYHLPAGPIHDMRYMFWSVDGFPRIGNGNTSFLPARLAQLRRQAQSFPDAASVAALRALGYRTVVLHRDRARGTPWADAALRPVAGLGISREERGPVVVYDLDPASAASHS